MKTKSRKPDNDAFIQRVIDEGTYTEPPDDVAKAIVQALLDSGANEDAALWVFQSKHLRWFNDQQPNWRGYWNEDGKGVSPKTAHRRFLKYLQDNNNGVMDSIKVIVSGNGDPDRPLRLARMIQNGLGPNRNR